MINLALLGLIWGAADRSGWGWLPFAAWMLGPTLLPYLLASIGSRRRWFTITMLVYCIVSGGIALVAYFDALYQPTSSTAGLIAIVLPIYQLGGLLIALAGYAVVGGWIYRDQDNVA